MSLKLTKKDINFNKGRKLRLYFTIIALRTNWWLRSPNATNTNNFYNVNSSGNNNNNNANNSYGVCFDFFLKLDPIK